MITNAEALFVKAAAIPIVLQVQVLDKGRCSQLIILVQPLVAVTVLAGVCNLLRESFASCWVKSLAAPHFAARIASHPDTALCQNQSALLAPVTRPITYWVVARLHELLYTAGPLLSIAASLGFSRIGGTDGVRSYRLSPPNSSIACG